MAVNNRTAPSRAVSPSTATRCPFGSLCVSQTGLYQAQKLHNHSKAWSMPDETPDLPPAAKRALAEAEARRKASAATPLPPELGGRDGPEPVRYGDWEKKGLAIDF